MFYSFLLSRNYQISRKSILNVLFQPVCTLQPMCTFLTFPWLKSLMLFHIFDWVTLGKLWKSLFLNIVWNSLSFMVVWLYSSQLQLYINCSYLSTECRAGKMRLMVSRFTQLMERGYFDIGFYFNSTSFQN